MQGLKDDPAAAETTKRLRSARTALGRLQKTLMESGEATQVADMLADLDAMARQLKDQAEGLAAFGPGPR